MDLRDFVYKFPVSIRLSFKYDKIKRYGLLSVHPGYSSDVFIDSTRQIKSDKPLPMSSDFLK